MTGVSLDRIAAAEARRTALLNLLRQAAHEGRLCPSNDAMAKGLGVSFARASQMLRELEELHLVRVNRGGLHHGRRVRVVSAPDGSWATAQPEQGGDVVAASSVRRAAVPRDDRIAIVPPARMAAAINAYWLARGVRANARVDALGEIVSDLRLGLARRSGG